MARRLNPAQIAQLRKIKSECDADDESTEYMIQLMMDVAAVTHDQVIDFLNGKYPQ